MAKKETEEIKREPEARLTETIWVKHSFTGEESMALGQKMAQAESIISEKADELKSVSTTIKADIAAQEGVLHSCAEKLRTGYEMRQQECFADYSVKGRVKYIAKDTGEVLEERDLTEDEQLRLSGKRTDAEDVIRGAAEEE